MEVLCWPHKNPKDHSRERKQQKAKNHRCCTQYKGTGYTQKKKNRSEPEFPCPRLSVYAQFLKLTYCWILHNCCHHLCNTLLILVCIIPFCSTLHFRFDVFSSALSHFSHSCGVMSNQNDNGVCVARRKRQHTSRTTPHGRSPSLLAKKSWLPMSLLRNL